MVKSGTNFEKGGKKCEDFFVKSVKTTVTMSEEEYIELDDSDTEGDIIIGDTSSSGGDTSSEGMINKGYTVENWDELWSIPPQLIKLDRYTSKWNLLHMIPMMLWYVDVHGISVARPGQRVPELYPILEILVDLYF